MGKGTGRLELIAQQNDLLREQNELLRQQVELLKNSTVSNDREIFIENINRDEMRSGFLVTSQRKKLWNVQLGLIKEFARICKKHNLRWFAFYGTMLGAVRHKGFIPWDDDADVIMFRPDYEKFKRIAPAEIKPPYYLDDWTEYRREDSQNALLESEAHLPLIKREQERELGFPYYFPSIKIKDSRTSMISHPDRRHLNQGIWIDVFPLDMAPPFENKTQAANFNVAKELFIAISYPDKIREAIKNNVRFTLSLDELKKFLALSHRQKALAFENFALKIFDGARHFNQVRDLSVMGRKNVYDIEDFAKTIILPFEKTTLPFPAGYDNILTAAYGDWHKMIIYRPHSVDNSADVSFTEYFKTAMIIT